MKIVIELSEKEIVKLEEMTDTQILDEEGFVNDDDVSDAIKILLENL
jgi:hypothetical protein